MSYLNLSILYYIKVTTPQPKLLNNSKQNRFIMEHSKKNKKIFASIIITILVIILTFALFPYIKALFGALILFVIFKPLYNKIIKKTKLRKGIVALFIIILSLVIVIIPLTFLISLLVGEVTNIVENKDSITENLKSVSKIIPIADLESKIQELISKTGSFLQKILVSTLQSVTLILINLIIMYFVLFYMLINSDKLKKITSSIIPFNNKNTQKLMDEFSNVTYSTLISTGLIAVLQGVLLGIGFLVLGIPGAILWGFIGTIFAFIPVVGIPIVWIPTGIIQIALNNRFAGIGILIWGFILSNIDNFLRPVIQNKVGKLHPLTTLIGVFIGLSFFGILGLILGPLLLSYFFLTMKMFNEEYLSD